MGTGLAVAAALAAVVVARFLPASEPGSAEAHAPDPDADRLADARQPAQV